MLAAALVLTAGIIWAAARHNSPDRVVAGPGPVSVVALPALGGVGSAQLADGTPVFVVHHAYDTVSVVSAVLARRPSGFDVLVGWCPSSRWFEDPRFGSKFDEYGTKEGGPAVRSLVTYDATIDFAGRSVRVGGARSAAPPGTYAIEAAGPHCLTPAEGLQEGVVNLGANAYVMPSLSLAHPKSPAQVAEMGDGLFHVVRGTFVKRGDGSFGMCPVPTTARQLICRDPILVSGVHPYPSTAPYTDFATYVVLARPRNGALNDIVVVQVNLPAH